MFKYRMHVGTKAWAKQIIGQKKKEDRKKLITIRKRKRRRRDQLKTHEQ